LAEKLKIIPLGGLNEIGKNMTVLEYGKDIIIVDCGLGFPDDEMYGVDLVIADMTYLVKNKDRIRGMFLTHGHEDHIGGIPYAMEQFRCPIHATRLTAGIVQLKLEEVISRELPFSKGIEAFREKSSGREAKVMLRFEQERSIC